MADAVDRSVVERCLRELRDELALQRRIVHTFKREHEICHDGRQLIRRARGSFRRVEAALLDLECDVAAPTWPPFRIEEFRKAE